MNERLDMFDNFWLNKKVLITGHTGFKGSWLYYWLNQLGAEVTGIALSPEAPKNLFQCLNLDQIGSSHMVDIRDREKLSDILRSVNPEIVFHLAAQSIVSIGFKNPIETFDTNIMGSVNLLDGLRGLDRLKAVVMVTTDKVYRNNGSAHPYSEDDELGGFDPYSASKAASELAIRSYADSFFPSTVSISTARAGNVIGGGDWAADRIIPDAIRSWALGMRLEIRNPDHVRPWQHVLEPLYAYLKIAEKTYFNSSLAGSYNIGPEPLNFITVHQLVKIAQNAYGNGEIAISKNLAPFVESSSLTLNVDKLRHFFGILPLLSVTQSVNMTINWYKKFATGAAGQMLCDDDIMCFKEIIDNA